MTIQFPSLAALFSLDQCIQVPNIHLEALAKSGVREISLPNEVAHRPESAAEITRCLGKGKQSIPDGYRFMCS